MKILLTGCAGFIGSHTLKHLLLAGHEVIGVDNFDQFYSKSLKIANIARYLNKGKHLSPDDSIPSGKFTLIEGDLANSATYNEINIQLADSKFDAIIHLAAKAGVRPSIKAPVDYQRSNVIATQNLLEFAKGTGTKQFVFASSSSVYGVNPDVPWSEENYVLSPISPYASTKISCELMGHVYSHLYSIRFLGLRFFTVYGPRQRPDLAINKFVRLIATGEPIPVFGDGSSRRDYTYVDDIVAGILNALDYKDSSYEIINLGNDQTISLFSMIATIEEVVGKKAIIDYQPKQPGDVPQTWANITKAKELLDYKPTTKFKEGIKNFYDWWNQQQS